jgi:hypothetical protein
MSETEADSAECQSERGDEIQPHHTDASEPASNAEQVLRPNENTEDAQSDEADPAAAERFAREADRSSVGRGT